jgi:hypothetical protein
MNDVIKKLKMKQVILKVSEEEHDIIKWEALTHKMTMKNLIIEAIADWIKKNRKEPK